ncbi:MAG: carboxypeptidase-like regulatory domain-containing protein [Bacteroides sp.]|nr:carboxypeptidase-like regulatory domain-containing protein [Bacteroides sp.]
MNKSILYFLTGTMTLLSPLTVAAQTKGTNEVKDSISKIEKKTITGTVLDEEGEPLPGATVMIEDTKDVTSTDSDGNFSVMTSKKNPTVVVSYVGMQTFRERLDKGGYYLRIIMKQAPNIMNEVVVTGYQNIKRESATGSYQVLTADDLDKRSTTDLASRF